MTSIDSLPLEEYSVSYWACEATLWIYLAWLGDLAYDVVETTMCDVAEVVLAADDDGWTCGTSIVADAACRTVVIRLLWVCAGFVRHGDVTVDCL